MNRKITLGGAFTLAIMLSTVTFIMTMIYAQNTFDGKVYDLHEREQMYSKLSEVDTKVRREFLGSIDEELLQDYMIQGYVAGLNDPYSLYLPAEQYSELMSSFEGSMVDIGISAYSQDASGYIRIDSVASDSAASVAGLEPGDLIINVDDLAVTADVYETAVEALKGEAGSIVDLLIRRGGVETTYSVTRRRMEVLSASHSFHDNIGYIRITEFNDNTLEQFDRALEAVLNEGVEGLIFDVRANPGGTMESVAAILDILLPEGPIVSSTDRRGNTTVLHESDANEINLPMAVLINGQSASAAELFAQALKDYDKATLIGTTTFGKGSMQKIYPLSDGSALDITVAFYNPPFSKNFDGIGVSPDFEVSLPADMESQIDTLHISADTPLAKALEVVSAKIKENVDPSAVADDTATDDDSDDNEDTDDDTDDNEDTDDDTDDNEDTDDDTDDNEDESSSSKAED